MSAPLFQGIYHTRKLFYLRVGKEKRGRELVEERLGGAEFKVGHPIMDGPSILPPVLGKQGESGARERPVAHEDEAILGNVRQKTDDLCLADV